MQHCPKDFLETENFASLVMEVCLAYLFKVFQRYHFVNVGCFCCLTRIYKFLAQSFSWNLKNCPCVVLSGGATCSDNSNWENMISVSLTTAKTLIRRLGPEVS